MSARATFRAVTLLTVVLVTSLMVLLGHPGAGQAPLTLDVLHSFQCADSADSCFPTAGLMEGSDGVLYGTTAYGGAFDEGTVFKVNKDGSGFAVLHTFRCGSSTNGCEPVAGLTEGSDGRCTGRRCRAVPSVPGPSTG